VPYWSEALLVVPRDGAPYLVAALTFRVKTWIERTSRLGDVLHNPRVGLKAAQQVAGAVAKNAVVGVVDFDGLPAGIADDLREGGPDLIFRDASELFATVRAKADPAEIALATKAAAIAHHALTQASGDTLNAMIAGVERQARLEGAEEIYIAAAPDLAREARFVRIEGEAAWGRSFALRATVAYKGAWVRLVRTFCETAVAQQARERFAQAVAQLPSGRGFASGFDSWLIEGCRLTQPLEAMMGARFAATTTLSPGALVSAQATLRIDGLIVPVGAPALLGGEGEAASVLVDPTYD
jgi:hypothetical protein